MTVELTAAVAVWGAWEALKVTGAAQAIVARMVGRQQTLSDSEKDAMDAHFEGCRSCQHEQGKQVELLQKISDACIEIKTFLQSQR
jgi:hypothetical protein